MRASWRGGIHVRGEDRQCCQGDGAEGGDQERSTDDPVRLEPAAALPGEDGGLQLASSRRDPGHDAAAWGFLLQNGQDACDRVVHVLVVRPGKRLSIGAAPIPAVAAPPPEPHPARKRRWNEMNEVLDSKKKAKVNSTGESSTGYSYVTYNAIKSITKSQDYELQPKAIEDDKVDALHAYLVLLSDTFAELVTGKEAQRLHFIVPVLACVCSHFNDARILAEETVVGKQVHADGAFELVVERGSKRVCIVEAKRDDFLQGFAQAYIGCEALADVEGLTEVYSIVTNYKEWCFSRSLDEKIGRRDAIILIKKNISTRETVKEVAELLYSMLSVNPPSQPESMSVECAKEPVNEVEDKLNILNDKLE